MTTVLKINQDRLGQGARRGITVTVTGTPTSLADLLDAAITGRTEMAGRRMLALKNTQVSSPQTIYILESTTQTVTEGIQIPTLEERFYEMSVTGTDNTLGNSRPPDTISKTFFATASGTATMTVEETA